MLPHFATRHLPSRFGAINNVKHPVTLYALARNVRTTVVALAAAPSVVATSLRWLHV